MLIRLAETVEFDRRVNNMSTRKVVAGLLITVGIAIMAVPFFLAYNRGKKYRQAHKSV